MPTKAKSLPDQRKCAASDDRDRLSTHPVITYLKVRNLAIVEIHGQHESHNRVAGQGYRELLDEYGDHRALLASTGEAHSAWRAAADQLRALAGAERDRTLRLDLLRYQIDEIDGAKIVSA